MMCTDKIWHTSLQPINMSPPWDIYCISHKNEFPIFSSRTWHLLQKWNQHLHSLKKFFRNFTEFGFSLLIEAARHDNKVILHFQRVWSLTEYKRLCFAQFFEIKFARVSYGPRMKRSMTLKVLNWKFCVQKIPEKMCRKFRRKKIQCRSDISGWKCVTNRSLMCC